MKASIISADPVVRARMAGLLNAGGVTVGLVVSTVPDLRTPGLAPTVVIVDLGGADYLPANADFWALLPETARIVVLCNLSKLPDIAAAVRGGVHALLTRDVDVAQLMLAVRTAHSRGLYICAQILPHLGARDDPGVEAGREMLTGREIETLRWITRGLTHRQIGRQMGVTEATVNTYAKRIRRKLQVGNKAELTRRALELGYATYEPVHGKPESSPK